MASTYTDRLGLEKQGDGENPNSWGTILNTNVIDLIDDAIAGYEIVSVSSTGITLSDNNGSTDQSRNATLEFAGTLTANVTITIPSEEKTYFVRENTTGSFAVQMKTAGGSAITLAQQSNTFVACDGTDIYSVNLPETVNTLTVITSASIGGTLDVGGNVGIKTITPGGDLHVQGDAGNSVRFYLTDGDTPGVTNSLLISKSGIISYISDRQAGSSLVFSTADTERMRIDSSGNVGIGTSSPLKQLHLTKSAVADIVSLTDGTSIASNFNTGQNFAVQLAGNRTLENPTNCVAGQTGSIFVIQDGTGSRTLSYGANWKFPNATAPTLSTAVSAVDRIDYIVYTSTAIHAVATLNVS